MDYKSLKTLEYHKIIEKLSSYAGSEAARKMCADLKPMTDINSINDALISLSFTFAYRSRQTERMLSQRIFFFPVSAGSRSRTASRNSFRFFPTCSRHAGTCQHLPEVLSRRKNYFPTINRIRLHILF